MVARITDDVVEGLIKLFKPFEECTKALSGEKYPTFPLIALWYHKLKLHLTRDESDIAEIQALRNQARICLEEYFIVQDVHYVACMLNPYYRKLKFADQESRQKAEALLRLLCDRFKEPPGLQDLPSQSTLTASIKKLKFAEFVDSDNECQESQIDEVKSYLNMPFKKCDGYEDNFDILKFWKKNTKFPKIKIVAAWLFSIPASQTADERIFSATGQTLTPRRTELNGSSLSMLTFLQQQNEL